MWQATWIGEVLTAELVSKLVDLTRNSVDHFVCHLLLEAFLNFWLALSAAGFAISGTHDASEGAHKWKCDWATTNKFKSPDLIVKHLSWHREHVNRNHMLTYITHMFIATHWRARNTLNERRQAAGRPGSNIETSVWDHTQTGILLYHQYASPSHKQLSSRSNPKVNIYWFISVFTGALCVHVIPVW